MQTKKLWMVVSALVLGLGACGGEPSVDSGDGSMTLFVEARVDNEGGNAVFDVDIRRNQVDVNDAVVIFESNLGDYTVMWDQSGNYRGSQAGWSDSYRIRVTAGEDWLTAAVQSPDPAILTAPDPNTAFDPHEAPGGIVEVRWSGTHAQSIRVRTKEFDQEVADEGSYGIPATNFTDVADSVDLRRTNLVKMAGGIFGSELRVRFETETAVTVDNPII